YSTSGSGMSVNLTNNLFERSHLRFYQRNKSGYSPFPLNIYNQTFYGGTNLFDYRDTSTVWTIRDSFFNTNTVTGGTQNFLNSHNGYFYSSMLPGGSNNWIVTDASYQIGPLGSYYYPNTGATGTLAMLINAGSRSASSAGLSEYTTTTNQ